MAFKFGASSTPSLFGGATSTAASSPNALGGSNAFGVTSSLFGGGLGASSSQSLFGGSSAPALTGGGFSFGSTAGGLFGSNSSPFGQSQNAGGFGQQSSPSFFPGAQQQTATPASALATVDSKQLTHYTKWEEINPQGQQQLLELEKIILRAKDDTRKLESCARLQDSAAADSGIAEANLTHTLQGFSSAWGSQGEAIAALNERVHELLQDTETAIRTFERSYRWREAAKANPGQVLPASVREMLSGPVVLPSHFLRKAIKKFQENVRQFEGMVAELERLLPLSTMHLLRRKQAWGTENITRELSTTITNTHDLLYHVAAKMDNLNERIETAKRLHLQARRRAGDIHDPFKEANRRDWQREAAAHSKVTAIPPAAQLPLQPQSGQVSQYNSSGPSSGFFGQSGSPSFGPMTGSPAGLFGQDARPATTRSRKVKK